MKSIKKLCLLFSILCFWSITNAQNSFGGKIGLNMSKWTGDIDDIGEDFEFSLGFQAGAMFQLAVSEKVSIQPEFIFIQKGVKSSYSEDFGGISYKAKDKFILNYLEIPILTKVHFGNSEGTDFFVTVGPSFGYAISGKYKSKETEDGETTTYSEKIEFEDEDGFNRFEISAAIGIGINLPAGPGAIAVEARYLLGLTNLNEDDDFTIKNSNIGVSIGYMVPLQE